MIVRRGLRFGWQGVEATIPPDWELAACGGDWQAGHAALDDGVRVRFRIHWHGASRRNAPSAPALLDKYRRNAARLAQTKQSPVQTLPPESLPASFRKGKSLTVFRIEDKNSMLLGAAWKCEACGRVILCEVSSPAGENPRTLNRRTLASVSCHPTGSDCFWSVYGFAFHTPRTYNLGDTTFESGKLAFAFHESRRAWLMVERWGMASVLLGRVSLAQWPREWVKLRPSWQAEVTDQTELSAQDGPEVRFGGTWRRRGFLGTAGSPRPLRGLIRVYPGHDKIVALAAGGGAEEVLDQVAQTVEFA